jgi:porphobilinogen deaminase
VATSFDNDRLAIEAVVLSRDGKLRLHSQGHGTLNDPAALGRTLADDLLGQGAAPLIEASRTGTIAPP